jgi:hypothetical protein
MKLNISWYKNKCFWMFYTILLCKYILFVNEDVVHGIVFMEYFVLQLLLIWIRRLWMSGTSFSVLFRWSFQFFFISLKFVIIDDKYQFLWIVHFWLLVRYSLAFVVLDLCPVYPMLPVSLDCPFLIAPCVFSNVCCPRLVSCVLYVASFFGLSISDCLFGIL